ncbi:MAG: DHH family phosphoesterase, partial [Candidatus Micrarchaeia archaeon]
LSSDEKMRLRSALIGYMHEKGKREDARALVGEVYELLTYPEGTEMSDASEFSTLLNACGRHEHPEIGIDVILMRPGAYEKARGLLEYHRKKLREGIEYATQNVVDLGTFYLLDGRGVIEDGIIGVIAGMLYGTINADKPIIAISLDKEKKIKVSGRATKRLVEMGIDLGKIMSYACKDIGVGGGHNIAAGATIMPEHLNTFIKRIGECIERK